eukprot:gene9657-13001_t
MSLVYTQSIPEVTWIDWVYVYVGLTVLTGLVFEAVNLTLPKSNKTNCNRLYNLTNFWLVLSGVIHCWIEFAFVFGRNESSFIRPTLDLYAAADYRYGLYNSEKGLMESGTHAMELITTLIDGPLCFLVVICAAHNISFRHPLQLILCTMQLYGLIWFTLQPIYSDSGVEGHFSCDPKMFWLIAVGANAPWAIFPVLLLIQSVLAISKSFSITNK